MKKIYRQFRDFGNKAILNEQEIPARLVGVAMSLGELLKDFEAGMTALTTDPHEQDELDMASHMQHGCKFADVVDY